MTESPAQCLNCDAPLSGPFCSQCGQRDQHRIVPLRHLLRDLFHEVVSVDHHVMKTFWALLTKPGLLTVDYLEGRRVRHLPPLRLYLLTSFLMFLTLGTLTPRWVKLNGSSSQPAVTITSKGAKAGPTAVKAPGARPAESDTSTESTFDQKMAKGGKKAAENPAAFVAQVIAVLPKAMFILLPVFAALLKMLYLRRRILYAAHIIFALHTHTAAYLMFLATIGLGFIPGMKGWMVLALCLGLPVYLALALHRAYGQSWLKTLVKGAILSALYLPLILFGAVGAIVWAVYQSA
jgi:hypothetical protein